MLELLFLSLQVRYTLSANRLIQFLRYIPLIKRAVPPTLYGNYTLKLGFTIVGFFMIIIKKILFRLCYAALLTAMGILFYQVAANGGWMRSIQTDLLWQSMDAAGVVGHILTVWFMFSGLGAFLGAVTIGSSGHEHDNTMINRFRASPAPYARARIVLSVITECLLYLPLLLLAFGLGGIPLWTIPLMLLIFVGCRLVGEMVNLLLFRYSGLHFGRLSLSAVAGLAVFAAAVFQPVIDWTAVLTRVYPSLAAAVVGAAAWLYIKRYTHYAEILRDRITRNEVILAKARQKSGANKRGSGSMTAYSLGDVKNWSKGVKAQDIRSGKHDAQSGFSYLNAIFFDRHGHFFRKKLLIRSALILLPLLAAAVLTVILRVVSGQSPASSFEIEGTLQTLFNSSPVFLFIIYIASMGRVVTASVFSNCDIHMLHYPYYRIKETILASFKARFAVILKFNAMITLLMALSALAILWLFYGEMEWLRAGIFVVLMLFMGIFFAFNDLFLYYVIQPYDSSGQNKSTLYKVIDVIVYIIAYINLQSKFNFMVYTAVVIAATVLYMAVGTKLLQSLAPRKFRLR